MSPEERRAYDIIVRRLTTRIRALETIQEGNGFVPYFFRPYAVAGTGTDILYYTHSGKRINVGQYCEIEITMPRKVQNLEEAILIYMPIGGPGTWDYTVSAKGGYCEEDVRTHQDSITANGEPTVNERIQCLDISGALTPFEVGDVIGVGVDCDALNTTTGILILGIRLR